MFLFCLVFAMFCACLFICALWSPAGKGLTSWLSFVVSSVSLSLSHWYPGSGVVLDCINSWSLHQYLLLEKNVPYSMLSCLLPYFLIMKKKSLVFNFYTKCKLILSSMLSLKLTKYFKVCYFYCPQKSICLIYPVFFVSFIELYLN